MIVKWCRGRSEGSRDGSSPRDLIRLTRQPRVFRRYPNSSIHILGAAPPSTSIDTGVLSCLVRCPMLGGHGGGMEGWLHGIAWGPNGLDIICIWYGMEKAPRSPGSVVPRNVYYPNRGES
jgi:hypothetical protein